MKPKRQVGSLANRHQQHTRQRNMPRLGRACVLIAAWFTACGAASATDLDILMNSPVDIARSAYSFRADRKPEENPPESWILLMQYANLPFDQPVNVEAPEFKPVLCGLLWEEVRPLRLIELSWPAEAKGLPAPSDLALAYFDGTDDTAHTWWNPRALKDAGKPEVSADGHTYRYSISVDTWGVIAVLRGGRQGSQFPVPTMRAIVPEMWKKVDLELEWGFQDTTHAGVYDGRIEAYDGIIGEVRPLAGDSGTVMKRAENWVSVNKGKGRRGVRLTLLYMGTSRWLRVWPYEAKPEDVARTILTVWTKSGSFSFKAADLEQGPILAPEYGFFVRATALQTQTAPVPPELSSVVSRTLAEKVDVLPGVPKVRGWANNTIPWFGANPSFDGGSIGSLTIPPRVVAMHPSPSLDVAVGWRSPIRGQVRVQAKVAMADSQGGNGIEWSIVSEAKADRQTLAAGAVNTGGTQAIPVAANDTALNQITVEEGESLSLVVGAKGGNHFCDTTLIELKIAEIGGQGRTWNLAADVLDNIHGGNPHTDAFGNPAVWRFYTTAAAPVSSALASVPPFKLGSNAQSAKEFLAELSASGHKTIRQRVREHSEQTWEDAVAAMRPGEFLPPHPKPAFEPPMQVDVPSERLNAQWKLGAWHILRHSEKDQAGKWHFNDYPFGILASETYMILRALDLQGMHKEAADGLDQWLSLPMQPRVVPGAGGHHQWALPDRPLGLFFDGIGCLTHAEGLAGVGGHMDGVHAMGPGAIMFAAIEHFRLTGDMDWLKAHAPRLKANADWILRQRRLLAEHIPGGQRLWSKGLQPAHVVTPDSERMHMQFYESEAYYWLAVKNMAELLTLTDPSAGARMAADAEAYRQDLIAAIDRSITLTPVVPVRDGTYHSFIPFAPYVRGFAAGAWGWRRCQGHVGAIYWDTVQSADPLISPSRLLRTADRRVQGHLDVLEDRLLLENTKVNARMTGYDPDKDFFSHASFQYQCGLERHANIHLLADDPPNFIRSMLNQYAVDIMPGEYTFREHTTGGPPDKIYEESCFLERFRQMLVMEDANTLWLARATPRAWLEQGKRISVRNAPTHFGMLAYEILSDVDNGKIMAKVELPSRHAPGSVVLRLRHPRSARIQHVQVNGKPWKRFDRDQECIRLDGLAGVANVQVFFSKDPNR